MTPWTTCNCPYNTGGRQEHRVGCPVYAEWLTAPYGTAGGTWPPPHRDDAIGDLRRAVEALPLKTLVTAGGREVATGLVERAAILVLLDAVRNDQVPVSPNARTGCDQPEGGQK